MSEFEQSRGATDGTCLIDAIRRRRAVRVYADEPVGDEAIRRIVEAARWASSASNRRLHRYLVLRDPCRLRLVQALAPGMLTVPPAAIVVCTDHAKARRTGVKLDRDPTTWIDVGTAAMNMMLAAQELGLGSCPVTSFSASGLGVALDLPTDVVPELVLTLGRPSPGAGAARPHPRERIAVDELIDWERIGGAAAGTERGVSDDGGR
jgi:nitroreductase